MSSEWGGREEIYFYRSVGGFLFSLTFIPIPWLWCERVRLSSGVFAGKQEEWLKKVQSHLVSYLPYVCKGINME